MRKLKKLALWLMMLVLVFSLAACGEKEDDDSKRDRNERVEESNDKDDDKDSKDETDDKKSKDDEKESEMKEEDGETKAKDEEPEVSEEYSDKEAEDKEVAEEPKDEALNEEDLIAKLISQASLFMTQATSNMEMEMNMSMMGQSVSINMVSTGQQLIQMNPYKAYSTEEMVMEVMGQKETIVSENYIVVEDGNLVSYSYDSSTDYWSKMDTGMREADFLGQQANSYEWLENKPASDFVVDSKLHNIDGRDAYKIEFTITGDEMNQTLNGMSGVSDMLEMAGLGDFDMSAIIVPAIYYIDAENYQIIQIEMSIEGMGEMMNDMMSSLLGADAAGYEMEFDIGKCYIIHSDISYEPVEVPALPAEATETTNVLDMEDIETDLGTTEEDWGTTEVQPEGGVYTIEESGVSAQITCPEDWTVTYEAYDTLDIENEETWQEAEFVMYVDVTRDDFVSYVEDMIVPELEQYGMYISHGAGPEIGSFETMEVLGDGLNFYFAWAPVGEGWILVTVSEFNGVSLDEALPPILELVNLNNVL